MIVPSTDISVFDFLATYDISGTTPQICLQADSVGPNQNIIEYIYKIITPSGVLVWEGDFGTPDATGNSPVFCKDIPLFNGSIVWSGGDYIVVCTMKDTGGNEWSLTKTAQICPPNGNNVAGSNYGQACLNPEVKCDLAEIILSDCTNYGYKNFPKTLVSKTITLIFPPAADGTTPAPVVVTGLSDVAIPITSNGNYEARLETVYSYDLGNGNTLTVLYTTYQKITGLHKQISVECNIDLCPLICEYEEFIDATEKLCGVDDVQYEANKRTLDIISAKMLLVLINKQCGKPVGSLIEEIKKISGFKCNCDCNNNGVVPRGLIGGGPGGGTYTFSCLTSCGDVAGSWSNPYGNNYVLTLNDKSYVFGVSTNMGTYGFSVSSTTVGCQKTYKIDINLKTFTQTILNLIGSDNDLKTLFCGLVSTCDLPDIFNGVDMMCIAQYQTNTCDYTLDIGGPNNPTDTFKGLKINGVWYYPPSTYQWDDATNINAWIATLTFLTGTINYVVGMAGNISLTDIGESNIINQVAWVDSSTSNEYAYNVTVMNCTTVTGTDKMQAIVIAICNIYNAMYGVSPILYKVKVNAGDATPEYLSDKVISPDGSVGINVVAEKLELTTKLKVDDTDKCGGNLIDKFNTNTLSITDQQTNIIAHDYTITSASYGSGYKLYSLEINGYPYIIDLLTTNLSGIQTALNAIGLGSFVVTSPAANIVITSLGNKYTIGSAVIETLAGPSYASVSPVITNAVLVGKCSQLFIDTRARDWSNITWDTGMFDTGSIEISSVDSNNGVFMNINLAYSGTFTGTFSVNPLDYIPVGKRPRTKQIIPFQSGWDSGGSSNVSNNIVINTNGLIEIEFNLTSTAFSSMVARIDSIYYPIN